MKPQSIPAPVMVLRCISHTDYQELDQCFTDVVTPVGPLAEKLDMNKTIPVSLQAAPPYMDLF